MRILKRMNEKENAPTTLSSPKLITFFNNNKKKKPVNYIQNLKNSSKNSFISFWLSLTLFYIFFLTSYACACAPPLRGT